MRAEFPWHRSYIHSARPRCASAIEFVSHFRAARRCSTRVERKLFWMRMREPHHHLSDTILHPLTKIVWHIVTQRLFSQTTGRWHKQIETARYVYTHLYLYTYTSSTAQGGGGSFKNTKPIGRVGCCDSRMAERIHWWTERWLELCFLEWLQWSPHHNCWM